MCIRDRYNYIQKVELYLDGEPTKEFYQYDLKVLKDGFSYKNAVLDLNVRLYPNNGSYKSVTWESSNELISVTEDGKCTPTKNESCYGLITCTVEDHFGNKYQDTVWVSYAFNPVTEVVVSPATISGAIGSTYQLSKTIKPEGTGLTHIGAVSYTHLSFLISKYCSKALLIASVYFPLSILISSSSVAKVVWRQWSDQYVSITLSSVRLGFLPSSFLK